MLRGADAYFKYVNARGGVNGRKITFKFLDDAYDPSRTVAERSAADPAGQRLRAVLGRRHERQPRDSGLHQRRRRAAGVLGGRRDDVRPRLREVPVDDRLPAAVRGRGADLRAHILATKGKKAKIAVLYQSDDYGKDLLTGFRKGLGAKKKQIVQTVGYDPTTSDVQSQVAQLKASGANTLAIFAFGKFAIQSFVYANKLGWKPQIYVNDVASASSIMKLNPASTAEGTISVLWGKDPATPKFAKDPGVTSPGRSSRSTFPAETRRTASSSPAWPRRSRSSTRSSRPARI